MRRLGVAMVARKALSQSRRETGPSRETGSKRGTLSIRGTGTFMIVMMSQEVTTRSADRRGTTEIIDEVAVETSPEEISQVHIMMGGVGTTMLGVVDTTMIGGVDMVSRALPSEGASPQTLQVLQSHDLEGNDL